MKNATLKSMLFCAAMASASVMNAQSLTFQVEDIKAKCINEATGEMVTDTIWTAHRTTAFLADFNNDGWMDVYYGGTSWMNGWLTRGTLLQNLGQRQWEMFIKPAYEEYEYDEEVKDEDGNPKLDDEGNPIVETKKGTREIEGLMDNGLPKSAWTLGSVPVDLNADGLVDMVLSNQGGNDTHIDGGIHIVKNLGDMQFRWMNRYDNDLYDLLSMRSQGDDLNEGNKVNLISAADYDKDGYPDLLVQFYQRGDNGGRRTMLLHNIKGERFEPVNVFKPLPFDEEINKRGIYTKTEETLDEFDVPEPGSYIDEPTKKMHAMTHGQVFMVDFDGDTYPDIIATGWMDGEGAENNGNGEEQVGGWNFRYYRNCQDGTFEDKTLELIANFEDETGLIEGMGAEMDFKFLRDHYGKDDIRIIPMDWNQDGTMDLLFIGSVEIENGWKSSLLWENYSDEEGIKFVQTNFRDRVTPFTGAMGSVVQSIDLNNDNEMDFFVAGAWMNYQDALEPSGDWVWGSVQFSIGSSGHTIEMKNDLGFFADDQSQGAFFVDLDNDGKLDMISVGSGNEAERISWNTTDGTTVAEAPEMPADLKAEAGKGTITLTWEAVHADNYGLLPYNVYCKNLETNEIRMMAPANIETGKQNAQPDFYTYLVRPEDNTTYTFENLPKGSYEVGVQTVAYTYMASAFNKTTIDVAEGAETSVAKTVASAMTLTVTVNGDNLIASSNENAAVAVFNAQGAQVAAGVTNEAINVKGHGIFVVKTGDKVAKVVK